MASGLDQKALHGRWLRMPEEDTGDELVYRPASHAFPPRRWRDGMELRPDGTAALLAPGPADVARSISHKWSLENDVLTIESGDPGTALRMHLVDVSSDRLVFKK